MTRSVPAYFIVTEYTQTGEDALAVTLVGKEKGFSVIYNTTRNKTRIWSGTVFEDGPMANPDGGTWSTNKGFALKVQALTSSPADNQTIYFGMLPKAPVTTAGQSKIYIRSAGIIKRAEIYCFSGTAGTAEAWAVSVRLNNTADTLIASVAASTQERIFTNSALNITVNVGDYIEIKCVNPAWATNPLTTIFGGYVYIE